MDIKNILKKEANKFLHSTNFEDIDIQSGEEEPHSGENLSELVSEIQKKLEQQESEKRQKTSHYSKHRKKNTLEEQRERAQQEEEKYDQLLNSVQAQNLIKTVDKMSGSDKKVETRQNKYIHKEEKKPYFADEPVENEEYKENLNKVIKIDDKKEEYLDDSDQIHEELEFTTEPDEKELAESRRIESVNINGFQHRDLSNYISSQCEIMEEATARIDDAMVEYSDVTEYFTDIQKIDQAPENNKKQIEAYARRVNDLSVDRRISKSQDNRLSTSAYHRMEQLQDEIPRGFEYMKKQESYYETVRRDMRMLEGEQLGYRLEARMLTKRQLKIRTFSIASMIGLVLAFAVFIIAMEFVGENDYVVYYILIAFIGAIMAVGLFALLKYTERQVLLTEIKLNKTTNLLNKTKIKYINAANTLDYEYSKFRVKSSYELEKKYQAYIEMKEDQKKVLHMTTILNEAEEDLEKVLGKLQLFDTHIWLGQVKALYNPQEMVEVRHDLTQQRQKLRNLIEYNEKRIEEAKQAIKNITVKHPEYTDTALAIINDYEVKNRK